MKAKADLYFRGLPTGPEVNKLHEGIDVVNRRGEIIEHSEVESILGFRREDNPHRYNTVTQRWRREVLDKHGIKIDGHARELVGVGFKALNHSEQVGSAEGQLGKAKRRVRAGWKEVALVGDDGLDEVGKKRRDHVLMGASQPAKNRQDVPKSTHLSNTFLGHYPTVSPPIR